MNKLIRTILALCMVFVTVTLACAPVSNVNHDNTLEPPATDVTETNSNQPAQDSLVESETMDADSLFPNATIEWLTKEADSATLKLTLNDGTEFSCEYGKVWPNGYLQNITAVDIDDGSLIALEYQLGHGQLVAMILAWFDGDSLEFVKWPFNDFEHYGGEQPMFDFSWIDDTTFELVCNLDGNTHQYTVNEEHYTYATMLDFSEFDRESHPFEVREIFMYEPDDDGNIEIEAFLSYGEYGVIALYAYITLQFNPETCSMEFKEIEYVIPDDGDGMYPVFEK